VPGPKTNEREGTRAVLRHARISPYKVREVLDLVRGRPVHEAEDILRFSERDAAFVVGKLLRSAVANAENNDDLDPEELYVSACFADEGTTAKRWRPRARGRATRIRKRTSHITVIVSRLPEEDLARLRAHRRAEQLAQRSRRVSLSRRIEGDTRNRSDRRRGVPVEEPEHVHEDEHVEDGHEGEVEGTGAEVVEAEDAGEADETAEGDHTAEGEDTGEAEGTAQAEGVGAGNAETSEDGGPAEAGGELAGGESEDEITDEAGDHAGDDGGES
jgi:large subunit ribosomal protein L22